MLKKKKKMKCQFCPLSFKSLFCVALHSYVHRTNEEKKNALQCPYCAKRFHKLLGFGHHIQLHGSSVLTKVNAGNEAPLFQNGDVVCGVLNTEEAYFKDVLETAFCRRSTENTSREPIQGTGSGQDATRETVSQLKVKDILEKNPLSCENDSVFLQEAQPTSSTSHNVHTVLWKLNQSVNSFHRTSAAPKTQLVVPSNNQNNLFLVPYLTAPNQPRILCSICSVSFINNDSLSLHLHQKHGYKTFILPKSSGLRTIVPASCFSYPVSTSPLDACSASSFTTHVSSKIDQVRSSCPLSAPPPDTCSTSSFTTYDSLRTDQIRNQNTGNVFNLPESASCQSISPEPDTLTFTKKRCPRCRKGFSTSKDMYLHFFYFHVHLVKCQSCGQLVAKGLLKDHIEKMNCKASQQKVSREQIVSDEVALVPTYVPNIKEEMITSEKEQTLEETYEKKCRLRPPTWPYSRKSYLTTNRLKYYVSKPRDEIKGQTDSAPGDSSVCVSQSSSDPQQIESEKVTREGGKQSPENSCQAEKISHTVSDSHKEAKASDSNRLLREKLLMKLRKEEITHRLKAIYHSAENHSQNENNCGDERNTANVTIPNSNVKEKGKASDSNRLLKEKSLMNLGKEQITDRLEAICDSAEIHSQNENKCEDEQETANETVANSNVRDRDTQSDDPKGKQIIMLQSLTNSVKDSLSESGDSCGRNVGGNGRQESERTSANHSDLSIENGNTSGSMTDCGKKMDNGTYLNQQVREKLLIKLRNEERNNNRRNSNSKLNTNLQNGASESLTENISIFEILKKASLNKTTDGGKSKVIYKCPVCDQSFEKFHLLNSHFGELHGFSCDQCSRKFKNPWALEDHIKLHTVKKVHIRVQCDFCEKSFISEESMRKHKQYIHRNVECDICHVKVAYRFFRMHRLRHIDGKELKCEICYKAFTRKDRLIKHRNRHSEEKANKSESPKNCVRSNKTKVLNRRFHCETCQKWFTTKQTLVRHIRLIHYKETKTCTEGIASGQSEGKVTEESISVNASDKDVNRQLRGHLLRRLDRKENALQLAPIENPEKDAAKINFQNMIKESDTNSTVGRTDVHTNMSQLATDSVEDSISGLEPPCADNQEDDRQINHDRSTLNQDNPKTENGSDVHNVQERGHKVDNGEQEVSETKQEYCRMLDFLQANVGQEIRVSNIENSKDSTKTIESGKKKSEFIKIYKCSACDQSFPRFLFLVEHFGKVHGFSCEKCSKKFKTRQGLEEHTKYHLIHKVKCDTCGRLFSSVESMEKHKVNIHRTVECDLCHVKVLKRHIKEHQRRHIDGKQLKCEICEKLFFRRDSLKLHLGRHAGKKAYECKVCSKRFAGLTEVKNHMKRHGEKEFKCTLCSKSFFTAYNLKTHVKKVHGDDKPFNCQFCGKRFIYRQFLLRHFNSIHRKKAGSHPKSNTDDALNVPANIESSEKDSKDNGVDSDTTKVEKVKSCSENVSNRTLKDHIGSESSEKNSRNNKASPDRQVDVEPNSTKIWIEPEKEFIDSQIENFPECEKCYKRFTSKYYLLKHVEIAHSKSQR